MAYEQTAMTVPQAILGQLHRADGSADYSHNGYRIMCAVNGPMEVQRRDEIPDEAAIEVNVRPAIGVGSPKGRHIESVLQSTLRHVILTHMHQRTLIQITLQILSLPPDYSDLKSSSHIALLSPLLNAATLALLSASIPLCTTPTATTIALMEPHLDKEAFLLIDPSPLQLKKAASSHVFAFAFDSSPSSSQQGDIILAESEGCFTLAEWEEAERVARRVCLEGDGHHAAGGVQPVSRPGVEGADEVMRDGDGDGDGDGDDGDDEDGGVTLDGEGRGTLGARYRGLLGAIGGMVEGRVVREQALAGWVA